MLLNQDRVRRRTARNVLARIDDDTYSHLLRACEESPAELAQRLQHLDKEWDSDRVLETEASLTALTGLALGALVNRRFFAVPGFVAAMTFLHATTGIYPLLPLLRRFGVRTAREIQRERYAVKALRGDFDGMHEEVRP